MKDAVPREFTYRLLGLIFLSLFQEISLKEALNEELKTERAVYIFLSLFQEISLKVVEGEENQGKLDGRHEQGSFYLFFKRFL